MDALGQAPRTVLLAAVIGTKLICKHLFDTLESNVEIKIKILANP